MNAPSVVLGIAILAAGTYLLRASGVGLRSWTTIAPMLDRVLATGTAALLLAVAASSAAFDGRALDGFARVIGVAVAAVAAALRAPIIVVVVLAAGATAGLRLLGIQ
ncbi:MAG: hypothetical protein QOH55_1030 [Microbacteriaceae bacterium]|nr:hypothetical protein [Microbacteriaceae bacterium]